MVKREQFEDKVKAHQSSMTTWAEELNTKWQKRLHEGKLTPVSNSVLVARVDKLQQCCTQNTNRLDAVETRVFHKLGPETGAQPAHGPPRSPADAPSFSSPSYP